jgi:hypothetical protein
VVTQHSPFHFSPRPNRAEAIPWLEWGAEALDRARAADRPILLAISASWSHWCHVMDETTYSDPRVIDLLTESFVAVRVDADERPDVDARYNAGGWPTTAFLAPDGEVITAAKFLRPEQLLELAQRVRDRWRSEREAVDREIDEARTRRHQGLMLATTGGYLTPELLDATVAALEARYDREHGGLRAADDTGDGPGEKYPNPAALRLLLYAYRRRGDTSALAHARFTLDELTRSALYDALEGGFFRSSARNDWTEPHYEKLAHDQGRLLLALGELALVDEDAQGWALPVVERTVQYLARVLAEASGGFYAAQDADPAYYTKNEPGRAAHGAPEIDRRVYAASTAALARGLMQCGISFRRRDWVERGLVAVDFLVSHMRAGEAGMYHVWDGAPHTLGMLGDQSETALALLQAYEVSGLPGYLDQARNLARIVERQWRDPAGAFWDTAEQHDVTGLLAEGRKPIDENAEMAEALLWLGRLTHDDRYLRTAQLVLAEFAGSLRERGVEDAGFTRVADRLLSAEPEFKIVAETPPGEPDRVADPLFDRALRLPLASRTVQRLYRDGDQTLMDQLGLPLERARVAYVCVGHVCSTPLTDPDQLMHAVEDALAAPAY